MTTSWSRYSERHYIGSSKKAHRGHAQSISFHFVSLPFSCIVLSITCSVVVKHVPSWFPGASYQRRLKTTREYVEHMKTLPFERVRAGRVSLFLSLYHCSPDLNANFQQRAGTAKPSLIGELLDDYELSGVVDPDHENDIKLVGAVMYGGTALCGFEGTRLNESSLFTQPGSRRYALSV